MISGELLFCGGTNWDTVGRSQAPKGGELTLPVFVNLIGKLEWLI